MRHNFTSRLLLCLYIGVYIYLPYTHAAIVVTMGMYLLLLTGIQWKSSVPWKSTRKEDDDAELVGDGGAGWEEKGERKKGNLYIAIKVYKESRTWGLSLTEQVEKRLFHRRTGSDLSQSDSNPGLTTVETISLYLCTYVRKSLPFREGKIFLYYLYRFANF